MSRKTYPNRNILSLTASIPLFTKPNLSTKIPQIPFKCLWDFSMDLKTIVMEYLKQIFLYKLKPKISFK